MINDTKHGFAFWLLLFLFCNMIHINCQDVCEVVEGSTMVKPDDRWISLRGPDLWFSDDEVCWVKQYFPELDRPNNGHPATIAFFNSTDGIIATLDNPNSENAKFFVTNNGGNSWTEQSYQIDCSQGFFPYQLIVLDDNSLLLTQIFSRSVLLSNDRGLNWTCIDAYYFNGGQPPDLEFTNNDTWYVATRQGIVKTTDQGSTHEVIVEGNFDYIEKNSSGDVFYAIGHDDLMPILYEIRNDGSTVESIILSDRIPDIEFVFQFIIADDVFYVFNTDILYKSLDFGANWEIVDLQNPDSYAFKVSRVEDDVYASRGTQLKLNCGNREPCDNSDIDIFPNPTDGTVFINTARFDQVHIYSIDGRLIESKSIEKDFSTSRIDLEDLNSGTYVLVLEKDEIILVQKVVKYN